MPKDVEAYFRDIFLPAVVGRFPHVAPEMSIHLHGSYGLGLADDLSDLDAVVWLDDTVWKSEGASLQLMIQHEIPRFLPEREAPLPHPEVSVWPLSWLADLRAFLEEDTAKPWERISFEELFQVQRNRVLSDPHGTFRKLKETTAPEAFPRHLWLKRLIQSLHGLQDALQDLKQVACRGRRLETALLNGAIVQICFQVGFLISQQYWPWRTHLRWAFEQLPPDVTRVLASLDRIPSLWDAEALVSAVQGVQHAYEQAILDRRMLTEPVLRDLLWAERLEAWGNENWQAYIATCVGKAQAAGRPKEDFWIWSLWG